MTVHSMCHPGRPAAQGESHAGSPGLAVFHRAKSNGWCLPAPPTISRSPPPERMDSSDCLASRP